MMRYLFLSILFFAACANGHKQTDSDKYDLITEKCYVLRQVKPAPGDTAAAAAQQQQQELTTYLEQHQFTTQSGSFRQDTLDGLCSHAHRPTMQGTCWWPYSGGKTYLTANVSNTSSMRMAAAGPPEAGPCRRGQWRLYGTY